MRFIVLILVLTPFLLGTATASKAQPLLTSITLNTQNGCAVHVAAWLSPSCVHCADYFASDIPKITAMPGFCLDLHFLPHLYLLDMHVATLIWSQGPGNALKIADLFFKNQKEWLDKTASRENIDDPRRAKDIEEFLTEIESDPVKRQQIKAYLDEKDPSLYVKMFALRHFSVEHLERYLPKNSIDENLSRALLDGLPRKGDTVVKFSPAFTAVKFPPVFKWISGQLLPEEQLYRGILTPSAAEDILKAAGPFVPLPVALPTAPPAPQKQVAAKASQTLEFDGAQDADEESNASEMPTKKKNIDNYDNIGQQPKKKQKSSPYDNNTQTLKAPSKNHEPSPYDDGDFKEDIADEIDNHIDSLETNSTEENKQHEELSRHLEKIINEQLKGLDLDNEGNNHRDSLIN